MVSKGVRLVMGFVGETNYIVFRGVEKGPV